MSVSLGPPSILGYITQIDMNTDGLIGVFSQADLLRLPVLTQFRTYANPSLSCRFALSALPTGLTALNLNNTPSVITGALSDLKAAMLALYLNSTASVITGGATAITAHGLTAVDIGNTAMSQTAVDGVVLGRLYPDWALFTANIAVNVGNASNAAPSGVYQSVTPPTTGKEAVFDLVNDPTLTGYKKMTITYTA
jgi:hypothetical protein